MGEFPSGQRGQTVNLLAMPSVVRIHLPPPNKLPDLSTGQIRQFLLSDRAPYVIMQISKTFLEHDAITQAQHDKSLHDLTVKMGDEERLT